MSYAEVFLLTWAVIATVLAVLGRHMSQKYFVKSKVLEIVVCELSSGELVPKKEGDTYTVENEHIRMVFRKES